MNYQQQSKRFVSQRKEFVIEEWYNQVLLSKDNHYLILKHLTTSGLGELFLSITKDNYLVVLKIFIENKYLENEIESTKLVNKKEDCILPYLDYFIIKLNNENYYVMVFKYFEGWISLREHLEKCLFQAEQKEYFESKILNVIDKVHNYSIVHNDLDDTKILIHPKTNHIKLLDLGFCITKYSRNILDEELSQLLQNEKQKILKIRTG
jgi:serine/threonine protein kinase